MEDNLIYFSVIQKIFFADITNVIGYSANRNTYVETYYLGACERAYPAIVYLMAYMLIKE